MNLKPFVGQRVVVTFTAGNAWLASHVDKGEITLLVQVDRETKAQGFIPSPFLIGTIVEKEGAYLLEIFDHNKAKLHVGLNPDIISTVTAAVEERIVRPSSLITP